LEEKGRDFDSFPSNLPGDLTLTGFIQEERLERITSISNSVTEISDISPSNFLWDEKKEKWSTKY
jgi:hypothetical protein